MFTNATTPLDQLATGVGTIAPKAFTLLALGLAFRYAWRWVRRAAH